MLDLPLDSLPAIPEKRNNEPRHRWFRIPAVRRSRADTPRQRVFRGCPADAVLAIDMATGSVWIRGNDPNGWFLSIFQNCIHRFQVSSRGRQNDRHETLSGVQKGHVIHEIVPVLELRALDHKTDVAGRIACHLDRVRGPVAVVPPFHEQERTAETTRDDQRHQSFVSMAESDSPLRERRQAASMPRPPDRDPGHGYRDNGSAGGNPSGDINHDNKSTPKAGGVMWRLWFAKHHAKKMLRLLDKLDMEAVSTWYCLSECPSGKARKLLPCTAPLHKEIDDVKDFVTVLVDGIRAVR